MKYHISLEYREAEREKQRAGKPWLEYYDKDRQREYMLTHRHYKRELELAGKLKNPA